MSSSSPPPFYRDRSDLGQQVMLVEQLTKRLQLLMMENGELQRQVQEKDDLARRQAQHLVRLQALYTVLYYSSMYILALVASWCCYCCCVLRSSFKGSIVLSGEHADDAARARAPQA